jgi:hypothetical protein
MTDCRALLAVPYGPHARQTLDLVVPDRPHTEAIAVLIPGGWWSAHPPVGRAQSGADLRPAMLDLAARGVPTATIGHRLLGEGAGHGGDIIADLLAGLTRLAEEAPLIGLPLGGGVALVGNGAGSLPALLLALRTDTPLIRCVVCAGPTPSLDPADGVPANLRPSLDAFAGADRAGRNPMQLPLGNLPPTLVLTGESASDTPAKLAARFTARLADSGVDHRTATIPHGAHQLLDHPQDKAGSAALDQISAFLRHHGRPASDPAVFAGSRA